MNRTRSFLSTVLVVSLAIAALGQAKPRYSYTAQKALIPAELGAVYLGMPLRDFAKLVDLSKAEIADARFSEPTIEIPFAKGNVTSLAVKVHGLTEADREAAFYEDKITRRSEFDNEAFETTTTRIHGSKISSTPIVYAMFVSFKKDFDLKKYLTAKYGKGQDRKPDDQYHFSDTEWTKKTSDGLLWLIRAFHKGEDRSLQLLGRIPGTEWGLDDVN